MNTQPKSACTMQEIVPFMALAPGLAEQTVKGLAVDSRKVVAGDCFLAFPGHRQDGRAFLGAAIEAGAESALVEADDFAVAVPDDFPLIPVWNLKAHIADIAKRFFGDPSRQLALIAITGTNGKTSVSHMVASACQALGKQSGVMGTLGNGLVGKLDTTENTTPDIVEANRILARLVQQGADLVAMEASSHGLVQGRLEGLNIDIAVITNITRDHLDYHGSIEAYRDAKALLVRHPGVAHVILNADDPVVLGLEPLVPDSATVWTYSIRPNAQASVVASDINLSATGMTIVANVGNQSGIIRSEFVAEFNASNLMAALTVLCARGCDLIHACEALSQVKPVAGRMEKVSAPANAPLVVVDFAHTPDALEKALLALRQHCIGKLWCVIGCGGERDQGKRPLMAKVATTLADEVVLTADNPRNEKLSHILADMIKGIPLDTPFQVIEDRAQALEFVISNAKQGDVLLLAGKGHEPYQEVAGQRYPYSDVEVSSRLLMTLYSEEAMQ